jgi:hypothetical protein
VQWRYRLLMRTSSNVMSVQNSSPWLQKILPLIIQPRMGIATTASPAKIKQCGGDIGIIKGIQNRAFTPTAIDASFSLSANITSGIGIGGPTVSLPANTMICLSKSMERKMGNESLVCFCW